MQTTIYASFLDRDQAIKAAGALLDNGVRQEDLTIIGQGTECDLERYQTGCDCHDTEKKAEEAEATAKHGLSVTTPADAAVGAAKGAGIGLGVGVAFGLAVLVIPGVGLVLGGGALAAAITAAALSAGAGAVTGGVAGYLEDQGVPGHAVKTYHKVVTNGGAILALTLSPKNITEEKAYELLSKYGGQDTATYNCTI